MYISGLTRDVRATKLAGVLIALLLTATVLLFIKWPNMLNGLLSSAYMPHLTALAWTQATADSLIGLAYLAISGALVYLTYRARSSLPFRWLFLAFGLFIIACGTSHFLDAITVWRPVYVLEATVKVVTALASLSTAAMLLLFRWLRAQEGRKLAGCFWKQR
jgi:hypothetical protein